MDKKLEQRFRIAQLLAAEMMHTLTEEEQKELISWENESSLHKSELQALKKELSTHREWIADDSKQLEFVDKEWKKFKRRHISNKNFGLKILVRYAAILVLPFMLGIFLWLNSDKEQSQVQTLIKPGAFKAELYLADGKKIILDSMAHWHIQKISDIDIQAKENQLSYKNNNVIKSHTEYNTLVTPRGGEYSVRLSDGTMVYMNAETVLHYPIAFVGDDRIVEMNGEAFFEVAKDRNHPFIVRVNGVDIKVIGTSFNINTYTEGKVVTTLLEGSVWVKNHNDSILINPDSQAVALDKGIDVTKVDARNYVLWKDGIFYFNNVRLEEIMDVLSRWYDVEIFYESQTLKDMNYSMEMPKYQSIDEILRHIEQTGRVHFKVTDRTVILSE